jgi:ribose transport system ATP-binding protein
VDQCLEACLMLFEVEGLSKTFAGTRVLSEVDLTVDAGEVHALVGQNGSGKSTLIKILAGYETPDAGGLGRIRGRELKMPLSASQAERVGLAFVHQDLGIGGTLTVAENFWVGRYARSPVAMVPWQRLEKDMSRRLEWLGVELIPSMRAGVLNIAERTLLAVGRAFDKLEETGSGVLILDEPTSALGPGEANAVLSGIRAAAARGHGVVFVSHRLEEVLSVADRVSVLRDGRLVGCRVTAGLTHDGLIDLMLGQGLSRKVSDGARAIGSEVLRVDGLSGGHLSNISFELRRGEIVGVTGLVGMGQDELPYLVCQARGARGGRIVIDGEPLSGGGPVRAVRRGIVFVSSDRKAHGGSVRASVTENMTLPFVGDFLKRGMLRHHEEVADVLALMVEYGIVPPVPAIPLGMLSGGNQQKVLMARGLRQRPKVLVLHDPTTGVDITSRRRLLQSISAAAERGVGVLMVSNEYKDLVEVCDRVLVLRDGRVAATLSGTHVNEHDITSASYGRGGGVGVRMTTDD